MSSDNGVSLPELEDWSVAAVRLLQGVVYTDDGAVTSSCRTSRAWRTTSPGSDCCW